MSARRRGGADARQSAVVAGAERRTRTLPRADPYATVAAAALVLAVLGTAILVDVRAAAAFDAPKRLVAMLGLVVAAASLAGGTRLPDARTPPPPALVTLAAALGVAAFGLAVATLASPRPAIACDGLRALVLFAAALPLGASRALDDGRARWLLVAFVVGAVVNALGSLAQAAGVPLFATALVTGRADTGGFVGNEGHLAQLAALALVAAGIVVLRPASPSVRAVASSACAVLFAALVVNRNLTALATAAAGGAVVVLVTRGRRGLAVLAIAALALGAVVTAYAPMRARLASAVEAMRVGDWDALTTYRLGPWSAALEMVRARPVVGFGPGTFGAEFARHRMDAEIRQQRRLVIPLVTSSFAEAHSDYLQTAAEGGIPTLLGCVVAGALLVAALVPVARAQPDARSTEALVVLALLAAAALAALTWFPWQLPVTMLPMLLAAGRGWRLVATAPPRARPATSPGVVATAPTRFAPSAGMRRMLALAGAVLLVVLVVPELRRYAAERRLARVTATLARVAAGGRIVPEARAELAPLATVVRDDAATVPADTRGLVAAGTAMLLAGDAAAARADYDAALARGERAEIDLNLARAYAVEGRRDEAEAALLRAGWLSPTLIGALPSADRTRIEARLADLGAELRGGRLTAPPPLPNPAESVRPSTREPAATATRPADARPGSAGED